MGKVVSKVFGGGGSQPKPPKPVIPPPPPTVDTAGVEEQVRGQKPTSREQTFLTGDLVPKPKKKTVLG
jgi:hypothetical protein